MERDQSLDEVIREMELDSWTATDDPVDSYGMSAADILTRSIGCETDEQSAEHMLNEALQMADILRTEFREQFVQMHRAQRRLLDQLRAITEAIDRGEQSSSSNAA